MTTVTAFDATRAQAIEDNAVVSGAVNGGGHLILMTNDGTPIDAGSVIGPIGPSGTGFVICTSGTRPATGLYDGLAIYEMDTKRIYIYNGTTWIYRGGLWICTAATRPAAPFNGLMIYETDTKFLFVYDGAAWNYKGGVFLCTAATRPAAPFTGLPIYETDTKLFYIYNGTAWVYRGGTFVCTAATRPAAPFTGMEIYETDTLRTFVYNGTTWRFVRHMTGEDKVEINFLCSTVAATTGAPMADWINCGNITVPPWATKARVTVSLTGYYDQTGAANTYALRVMIGTVDAGSQVVEQGKGIGVRFSTAWTQAITLTGTGTKAFKIQAAKIGGTGTFTTDGSCFVSGLIEFLP